MKLQTSLQKILNQHADIDHLNRTLGRIQAHLEANESITPTSARSVLRTSGLLDDVLLREFQHLVTDEPSLRVVVYDLMTEFEIDVAELPAAGDWSGEWYSLLLAGYATQAQYPLSALSNISGPPQSYSPAGMILQQTAGFMRKQLQRSATERGRFANRLAYDPSVVGDQATPGLDTLEGDPISPAPPHFRSPVPVNYPEFNPPVQISIGEIEPDAPPAAAPVTAPQIRITADEVPQVAPRAPRVTPSRRATPRRRPSNRPQDPLGQAIRKMFKGKDLASTKLRIVVQDKMDGQGLYGLQVTVRNRRVRSFVAGTTNQNGVFLCELPVLVQSGLTYDVEVTWPRDFGGEVETKSITLNHNQQEFTLPFYHQFRA